MSTQLPSISLTHVSDGDALFVDMGTLWTQTHKNPDFVRRTHVARALSSAQAQVTMNEASAAVARETAPALRRVRWAPAVIYDDERNTGAAALLKFGTAQGVVFGEQHPPLHPAGTVYQFGGHANFTGIHTYPLHSVSGTEVLYTQCAVLTSSITDTVVALTPGVDFIIVNGTLIVREECDPFNSDAFLQSPIHSTTAITLWLCDAVCPADWIPGTARALGMYAESTELGKLCVNAIWDAISLGAPKDTIQRILYAMYGVPVAMSGVVEVITHDMDHTVIVTNNHVYRLPRGTAPSPAVVVGAVLTDGTPLCAGVDFYPPGATLDVLRDVLPAITFPRSCFSANLEFGLCVGFDEVQIVCTGADCNGNPKLMFALDGTESDVTAFWAYVWESCAAKGVSLADVLSPWVLPGVKSVRPGTVYGSIAPLEFMLNLTGAATAIAIIDLSKLRSHATLTGISDVSGAHEALASVIPAYARLFTLVKDTVSSPPYSLDTDDSLVYDYGVSLMVYREVSSSATAVTRTPSPAVVKKQMTYTDAGVRIKWVPACTLG